ncbi:sperm acrosome membrane-associated protein 4-like [Trichosurus vulpecula]|uniref:sperm acrosome membrane-associated protein 4-like n=1 Tax=Trichosurus vulpecula TaxID=9337 RepID=UPI00186AD47D|nr:sperm acrosome membrane-associated protein 4-like [Trichosurus vulpecula]
MGTLSSLSLCLTVALACVTMVATKHCYYCDLTNMGNCVGTPMYCGEEEDCYYGRGTATGLTHIVNRGCVEATHCNREWPISYMGATYSFVTYCCHGNLCNAGPPGPKQAPLSFTTIISGLSLTLLLGWIL